MVLVRRGPGEGVDNSICRSGESVSSFPGWASAALPAARSAMVDARNGGDGTRPPARERARMRGRKRRVSYRGQVVRRGNCQRGHGGTTLQQQAVWGRRWSAHSNEMKARAHSKFMHASPQLELESELVTANICRMARLGFGGLRTGVIFGCHQNPTLERQILTRVGFEPELGFIDSG